LAARAALGGSFVRRSPFFALALLALGASLPAACTQNFDVFGSGGNTTTTSTTSSSSSSSSTSTTSTTVTGCTDDTQCDDGKACTTDTCNTSTGACVHANKADGSSPDNWSDQMKDCKTDVCQGGTQTTVPLDTDVPDGDTCLSYTCDAGTATPHNTAANTPCGAGGSKCDGSGHCVGCVNSGDCPYPGTCKTRHCDANGVCAPTTDAAGSPCGTGGNNVCDSSANCVECLVDGDCNGFPQICVSNQCQSSCNTTKKDGNETDVDCGGSCSTKCGNGLGCVTGTDCVNKVCTGSTGAKTCQAPTCSDNVQNGSESDKDCGGSCNGCANGLKCVSGGDCSSGHCVGNLCVSQCADGAKDGTETDVDCGGSCSTKCAVGKGCGVNADCTTGSCDTTATPKVCLAASCTDSVQNGTETDVDCGGSCSTKCADGLKCSLDTDCTSAHCYAAAGGGTQKTCHADLCSDGTLDGTETDVDCGGSCSTKCGSGKNCSVASDCTSNVCKGNGTCQ
jgi:hypothetical protein